MFGFKKPLRDSVKEKIFDSLISVMKKAFKGTAF